MKLSSSDVASAGLRKRSDELERSGLLGSVAGSRPRALLAPTGSTTEGVRTETRSHLRECVVDLITQLALGLTGRSHLHPGPEQAEPPEPSAIANARCPDGTYASTESGLDADLRAVCPSVEAAPAGVCEFLGVVGSSLRQIAEGCVRRVPSSDVGLGSFPV